MEHLFIIAVYQMIFYQYQIVSKQEVQQSIGRYTATLLPKDLLISGLQKARKKDLKKILLKYKNQFMPYVRYMIKKTKVHQCRG